MENFQFFYLMTEARNENDDWRQKLIWHRTSTGKRNRIKVKSLPADQQYKYAPKDIKDKRRKKMSGINPNTPSSGGVIEQPVKRVFTVYYSADRPNGFNKFDDGKLVMVTDDSAMAISIEKKGHKVAIAHRVPLEAFTKFWNYETKNWESFDKDIEDEKKFELIKWTNLDIYLCDFFKYKEKIDFQLSDQNQEEEEKDNDIK